MDIIRLSENTIIILLPQEIEQQNIIHIQTLVEHIQMEMADTLIDIVPAYASIHITFNTLKISGANFQYQLEQLIKNIDQNTQPKNSKDIIEIPVYYGEEVALDLDFIAQQANIDKQQVIAIHRQKIYDTYAIGFSPGFAYLGKVDQRIATPRKKTPRTKVAAGSVAIANQQTAVYPSDSPGGWQIIGRTPIKILDYTTENLTRFKVGHKIKFIAIDKSDYLAMGGEI